MPRTKKEEKKLKTIGARIKAVREEKGYTQKELAHIVGKDPQSIHRVEIGSINASILYISELCEGLEITVAELLEGIL